MKMACSAAQIVVTDARFTADVHDERGQTYLGAAESVPPLTHDHVVLSKATSKSKTCRRRRCTIAGQSFKPKKGVKVPELGSNTSTSQGLHYGKISLAPNYFSTTTFLYQDSDGSDLSDTRVNTNASVLAQTVTTGSQATINGARAAKTIRPHEGGLGAMNYKLVIS